MYDFVTAPFWILIYEENLIFFLISVQFVGLMSSRRRSTWGTWWGAGSPGSPSHQTPSSPPTFTSKIFLQKMIIETVGFTDVFLFYSRRCISSLSATKGGYFAFFDNNKKQSMIIKRNLPTWQKWHYCTVFPCWFFWRWWERKDGNTVQYKCVAKFLNSISHMN